MVSKYMRDDDGMDEPDPVFNQSDPIEDSDDAEWDALHDRVHPHAVKFVAENWGDVDSPDDVLSEEVRLAASCMGQWLVMNHMGTSGTQALLDRETLHTLIRACIQLGYSMKHSEDNGLLTFGQQAD